MGEIFLICIMLGIAAGYVTKALILEEKSSHEGPFKLKNTFITFPVSGHNQRATFFDRIRRVFGVYDTTQNFNSWVVIPDNAERWTCPFCLSFWTSLLFSVPLLVYLLTVDPLSALLFPALHFFIAVLGTITAGVINYVLRLW